MGVFEPLTQISIWVSLFVFVLIIIPSFGDVDSITTPVVSNGGDIATSNSSSKSPPPFHQERTNFSPFRPSIAVVIGVLTTMFSITFLLLLYAKHCKGGGNGGVYSNHAGPVPLTARRNSGIDRAVIDSLPIFRFDSLRGHKDGLECAVCLTRFELTEVLRLLPKCKHAFHVECVDTWLDSHSTCPLCRYRVDPEDILLIEDVKILHENQLVPPSSLQPEDPNRTESEPELNPGFRRISGRHSSAGEHGTGFRRTGLRDHGDLSSPHDPTSFRRSLDSARLAKKTESVAVRCFDRPRKDGLLLNDRLAADRKSFERRFGHRIIVSAGSGGGFHRRWSDVQPSDLLYLRSEMIISDSHQFSFGSSRPSLTRQQHQNMLVPQLHTNTINIDDKNGGNGRDVINSRSVSEITGLSRFSNRESNSLNRNYGQRQAGLVSRWLAWVSSHSQPAVRWDRTTSGRDSVV